jgi:hypothetical protein
MSCSGDLLGNIVMLFILSCDRYERKQLHKLKCITGCHSHELNIHNLILDSQVRS